MESENKDANELLREFLQSDLYKKQEELMNERRKTLKRGDNVVHFQYLGIFESEDLVIISDILKKSELELSSYNNSGVMQNHLDSYELVTFLAIHQVLINELLKDIATNAAWDVIKETMFFIIRKLRGKKINRITSTTIEERDISFGLNVNLDHNTGFNFELKGDVSDELIATSLDKVLVFLKEERLKDKYQFPDFVKFSEEENKWIKIDVMEEIKKSSKNGL